MVQCFHDYFSRYTMWRDVFKLTSSRRINFSVISFCVILNDNFVVPEWNSIIRCINNPSILLCTDFRVGFHYSPTVNVLVYFNFWLASSENKFKNIFCRHSCFFEAAVFLNFPQVRVKRILFQHKQGFSYYIEQLSQDGTADVRLVIFLTFFSMKVIVWCKNKNRE